MAQPNVAREPSMEEILASIRRIIENNEPPEEEFQSEPETALMNEGESISLTVDNHIPAYDLPEIPARAEAETAPVIAMSKSSGSDAERPKPMSLADVAARVRATAERGPIEPARPASEPAAPKPSTHSVAAEPSSRAELYNANQPYSVANDAVSNAAPAAATATVDVPVESSRKEDAAPIVEPAAQQLEESRAVPAPVATPILSANAGEQVAKSFDELAQALSASPRSLDDIAQEMLRPMLQDWLDNNLPTLVERLVREEIERVARGPRR